MVIILYLWYIQNGAPKLLLMAEPLKHPQYESGRDGCRGKRRCLYLRLPRTHVCRYFLCGYPCTYTVKFITRTKKQKCGQATKEPPSYKSDDFVVFQFHVWVQIFCMQCNAYNRNDGIQCYRKLSVVVITILINTQSYDSHYFTYRIH